MKKLFLFALLSTVLSVSLQSQSVDTSPRTGGVSTISCVGTPGSTTGMYHHLCHTAAGALYVCNNAAGCTIAGDWVTSTVGTVTSVGFTGGLISVATATSTPAFTVAGTSGGIPYFSSSAAWATSGALTANGVVLGGGAGAAPTVTAADSTTTHFLAATATAPAFRALATGDLPAALANQTSINGLGITASTGTLTVTNAKTLSVSNTLTLAGTDATTMTFPTTSATIGRTDAAQTFTGVQTFSSPIAGAGVQLGATAPVCTTGTAGFLCAKEGTVFTNVASTAGLYPDSTAHEFFAATNGAASAGMLVRAQPGVINQTAKVALISTATLCAASAGACNIAGQYHVHWNFWGSGTACSSVTAGSVTFLLTWTDENAVAHSAVALQMMGQTGAATTAMGGTFPFQTVLANEGASGDYTFSTNGTVIQYATGYTACTTGTGTYNLRAAVTRLQ